MKDIQELREFIGQTMKDLRDNKIDVQKAKALSNLANVIVHASKVESDFLRTTKAKAGSSFLLPPSKNGHQKQIEHKTKKHNG